MHAEMTCNEELVAHFLQRAASSYQAGLYLIAKETCEFARRHMELVEPESELIDWCRECSIWCGSKWSMSAMPNDIGLLINLETC